MVADSWRPHTLPFCLKGPLLLPDLPAGSQSESLRREGLAGLPAGAEPSTPSLGLCGSCIWNSIYLRCASGTKSSPSSDCELLKHWELHLLNFYNLDPESWKTIHMHWSATATITLHNQSPPNSLALSNEPLFWAHTSAGWLGLDPV